MIIGFNLHCTYILDKSNNTESFYYIGIQNVSVKRKFTEIQLYESITTYFVSLWQRLFFFINEKEDLKFKNSKSNNTTAITQTNIFKCLWSIQCIKLLIQKKVWRKASG